MKNLIAILMVTLMASTALANGNHHHDHEGDNSNVVTNTTTTTKHNEDASASSPASLVLGTCQSGLSVNTQLGGGAIASPDSVCLLYTLAQLQRSAGHVDQADATLNRAAEILNARTNPVIRFFESIPLLRRIF